MTSQKRIPSRNWSTTVAIAASLLLLSTKVSFSCAFLPRVAIATSHNTGSSTCRAAHFRVLQAVAANQQQQGVEIGSFCQGGSDPKRPQKVNQDAFFQVTFVREAPSSSEDENDNNKNGCYTCVGVLDGHGLKGHEVSYYLARQLPLHLQKHLEDIVGEKLSMKNMKKNPESDDDLDEISVVEWEEFEQKLTEFSGLSANELAYQERQSAHQQAMTRAFHSVHWAAMQDTSIPAGRNGATCVMLLFDHSDEEPKMHVAHVGDSRAIQIEINGGAGDATDYTVHPLSLETTVKVDAERERMEAGEGSIRGNNIFYGPVGIAMTRSLGNAVMLRAGVVPTPIVETFSMPSSQNGYVVLGTDGIWDVLPNNAVADLLVASPNDVQDACQSIAVAARQKWVGDLPIVDEEKVDDITCMVLRL